MTSNKYAWYILWISFQNKYDKRISAVITLDYAPNNYKNYRDYVFLQILIEVNVLLLILSDRASFHFLKVKLIHSLQWKHFYLRLCISFLKLILAFYMCQKLFSSFLFDITETRNSFNKKKTPSRKKTKRCILSQLTTIASKFN